MHIRAWAACLESLEPEQLAVLRNPIFWLQFATLRFKTQTCMFSCNFFPPKTVAFFSGPNLPFSDLPTCTDFRGTYRFWPSITISRFHAGVYRFWKMREFLGLSDFDSFCFRRYSRILPAFCTYRQSRRCIAPINSPPYVMNQC